MTDTKPVQMMNMEATFCMGNTNGIKSKVRELPFQNNHLSMLVLLPTDVEDESTDLEKVGKTQLKDTLAIGQSWHLGQCQSQTLHSKI